MYNSSRSDGILLLEYLPLHPKESVSRVTANSQDLGIYHYSLKLTAIPSSVERPLHFRMGLGGYQTMTFRFISYVKQRTEYTCKLDNQEFSVDKVVNAPAATSNGGVEVCVDVTYEPSRLGDARTQLVVSSAAGGDYICYLQGHCTSPRPQGPVLVKAGTPTSVTFKNVFNQNALFLFVVDNPAFVVKASETIGTKKTIQLMIAYKQVVPVAETKPPVGAAGAVGAIGANAMVKPVSTPPSRTGKLTITNQITNIAWVYYLKYSTN